MFCMDDMHRASSVTSESYLKKGYCRRRYHWYQRENNNVVIKSMEQKNKLGCQLDPDAIFSVTSEGKQPDWKPSHISRSPLPSDLEMLPISRVSLRFPLPRQTKCVNPFQPHVSNYLTLMLGTDRRCFGSMTDIVLIKHVTLTFQFWHWHWWYTCSTLTFKNWKLLDDWL